MTALTKIICRSIILPLVFFILGALVGAGGFYFYATKVLIPQGKTQMMNEIFSSGTAGWENFFKKAEEEGYTNPFEGTKEGVSEGGITVEEYVNPFELLGEK